MTEESPRRQDDIVMGQLLQSVKDLAKQADEREKAAQKRADEQADWCRNHDDKSDEWRKSVDGRLKPVEDWVSNANWSWKLFLGVVVIVGAILKCWDWAKAHLKG